MMFVLIAMALVCMVLWFKNKQLRSTLETVEAEYISAHDENIKAANKIERLHKSFDMVESALVDNKKKLKEAQQRYLSVEDEYISATEENMRAKTDLRKQKNLDTFNKLPITFDPLSTQMRKRKQQQ